MPMGTVDEVESGKLTMKTLTRKGDGGKERGKGKRCDVEIGVQQSRKKHECSGNQLCNKSIIKHSWQIASDHWNKALLS